MSSAFVIVGALFFVGHLMRWAFLRTRIPDLLLLVLVGQALGPLTGLVTPEDFAKVSPFLTELSLVVILLEGSLGLSFAVFRRAMVPALKITLGSFFLFVPLATLAIALTTPLSWMMAAYAGVALGSTSAALVIPMVNFLSISDRTRSVLVLESTVNDLLVVLFGILILEVAASGGIGMADALTTLLPATAGSVLVGTLAGLAFALTCRYFPPLSQLRFATEVSVCLMYGVGGLMGLNGAFVVLAMGLVLGNLGLLHSSVREHFRKENVQGETERTLLSDLTFLLRVFFFIYLGASLHWEDFNLVGLAASLAGLVFLSRYVVTRVFFRQDQTQLDAFTLFAMGPRGLACAAVAALGAQRGINGGTYVESIVFMVIPLTLVLTSLLFFVADQFAGSLPIFRKYVR